MLCIQHLKDPEKEGGDQGKKKEDEKDKEEKYDEKKPKKREKKRMKRTPDKTQNEKISHDISPYFHRNSSYIPRLLALEEAIPSAHVQHVCPQHLKDSGKKKKAKVKGADSD